MNIDVELETALSDYLAYGIKSNISTVIIDQDFVDEFIGWLDINRADLFRRAVAETDSDEHVWRAVEKQSHRQFLADLAEVRQQTTAGRNGAQACAELLEAVDKEWVEFERQSTEATEGVFVIEDLL
jgi:hypothetical protein